MYWKRFAELATAWLRDYRSDPFFRTETNVISIQVAFAAVIVGIIGVSFSLLYHNLTGAILEGMRASLNGNPAQDLGASIVSEIGSIRAQSLWIIICVIALVTALFGYVAARVALKPTKDAMAAQKLFIGNVAHELRTPLAIIKTNAEIALFDKKLSEDAREAFESSIEELDRISQIINNLLSLSALIRPERVTFAAIDFSAVVERVVESYRPLANVGGVELDLRESKGLQVWGNETALEQIVGNVVKNAIIYTPPGGSASISLELALNNRVELAVRDTGSGIKQEDLLHIFEPFYRADSSRTQGEGLRLKGTGLGLTIVYELVKSHAGKIAIQSTLSRGTAVTILLPGAVGKSASTAHPIVAPNEVSMDFS